ncbi:ANTAR domain-containing protein [Streptomyces sp. ME109]|uniref:ANTAR domain-containing protein n=1 Tax=Streptomyces sp. me109 TaxID=1827853 RepID=UPI0039672B23
MDELQGESAQLQDAVRSPAVVDRAIGRHPRRRGLTPDQRWGVLGSVSMATNIKIRQCQN